MDNVNLAIVEYFAYLAEELGRLRATKQKKKKIDDLIREWVLTVTLNNVRGVILTRMGSTPEITGATSHPFFLDPNKPWEIEVTISKPPTHPELPEDKIGLN